MAGHDRAMAAELLVSLYADSQERNAATHYLELRTRNFVRNPFHWHLITALALELQAKETLKGAEIDAVISKSIKNYCPAAA
jgi:hypothetical protein